MHLARRYNAHFQQANIEALTLWVQRPAWEIQHQPSQSVDPPSPLRSVQTPTHTVRIPKYTNIPLKISVLGVVFSFKFMLVPMTNTTHISESVFNPC